MKIKLLISNLFGTNNVLKDLLRTTRLTLILLFLFSLQLVAENVNGQGAIKNDLENKASITLSAKATQQTGKTITGIVVDTSGDPVIGATIIVKGDVSHGTVTDIDGKYILPNISRDAVLVFSFIGMQSQEVVVGNQTTIDVTMIGETIELEEVVAVGFGKQRKETVTGAINTVDSKVLLKTPVANISNMLTGRVPGIITKQERGIPGFDEATIRIRGVGTFAGNLNPLIMIDGIESNSRELNMLSPNEVESISVLKDASATAVYGVRGANGVILVTTNSGAVGKPVINLSANYGLLTQNGLAKGLDAVGWTTSYNLGQRYDSYVTGSYLPRFSDEEIEHYRLGDDPIFYPNSDWIGRLIKPAAPQTQQHLSLSGGGKTVKYYISLGHFSQEGLFADSKTLTDFDAQLKYHRYNIRTNFDIDFTKRLSANIKLSSQLYDRHGAQRLISMDTSQQIGVGLFMAALYLTNPMCSPGIVDGKLINSQDFYMPNPYKHYLDRGIAYQYHNNVNGLIRLNYDLDFVTKGLSVHGTVSYHSVLDMQKEFQKKLITWKPVRLADNSISYYPQDVEGTMNFGESRSYAKDTYLELGLDYLRSFGNHNVSGLILYNQSKYYPGPSLSIPRGLQGLVGRITYDYSRKYLAEVNLGYNGTENFAKGRRFGLFPAFSLGWVVSEEGWFPENNIVSYLKFRTSYGEVGNDQVGGARFMYRPTAWTYFGAAYWGTVGSDYGRYEGAEESTIGNELLTWERAKKTDIGIDVNFFDNKLRVTADWFNESRDNILATLGTVPEMLGISLPPYNLGKMVNRGYDGDVTYRDRIGHKFNYYVSLNYTFAQNEIIFMDEVPQPPGLEYQYKTGQRFGQEFGYLAEGYYNTWDEVGDAFRPKSSWNNNKIQPGDVKYRDVNGDGIISSLDYVPIGYSNYPEIFYGISFGGNYGGLDFSVLFQGASNVSYYASQYSYRPFFQDGIAKEYIPDYSWTQEKYEEGKSIKMPRMSATTDGHNYQTSSQWLNDASYVRLKNLEIGYSFTSNFLQKLRMTSARVFVNGSNLITWKKVFPGEDPEETRPGGNENYPPTQVYNLGINVNF